MTHPAFSHLKYVTFVCSKCGVSCLRFVNVTDVNDLTVQRCYELDYERKPQPGELALMMLDSERWAVFCRRPLVPPEWMLIEAKLKEQSK